jgi:glycosyltransferase involved in cell wall biosynthesis
MSSLNQKKHQYITVGIPAFNEEANIVNCITSVLAQRGDNYDIHEVLVISDGSTDATVEKARSIESVRVQVISADERLGQNIRQNQLIEMMSPRSTALFILEADRILDDTDYMTKMVDCIPEDGRYSFIAGRSSPLDPQVFFEKIMVYGFLLRQDIFDQAVQTPNLHQYTSARLFSREFLENFRWESGYHEDTYSYRKAIESRLPLYRQPQATTRFRSVTTLRDYLVQSGKYLKAADKEKSHSDIYQTKPLTDKLISLLMRRLRAEPILFISYVGVVLISRMNKIKLPSYTELWETYKTSKSLNIE